MAGRGPQTFKKRQKEQARKEKQEEKRMKRLQRSQGLLKPATDDDETETDLDLDHVSDDLPDEADGEHAPAEPI